MSLIELMIAVAVGAVAVATFATTFVVQRKGFSKRLEHAEVHQNGRAAISILNSLALNTGGGHGYSTSLDGAFFVGACNNETTLTNQDETGCNSTTATDRLRLSFANASRILYKKGTSVTIAASDMTLVKIGYTGATYVASFPNTAVIANGSLAVISGTCDTATKTRAYLLEISASTDDTIAKELQYTTSILGSEITDCTSVDASFTFGEAVVYDFKVDTTTPAYPVLKMRRGTTATWAAADTAAYNIEDFQVEYGIDTSATPDHVVDYWCDDPDTTTSCSPTYAATGFTTKNRIARIVGVRIFVVARTKFFDENYKPTAPITVADHTIASGDGYQRWVYATTIAMRNNAL